MQELPTADITGLTHVHVGLTERGLDEIGNVLRCNIPSDSAGPEENDNALDPRISLVAAGNELLSVEWDAYTITNADELYHAAWGNVEGTASFTTPLSVSYRISDFAGAAAV
jgi:hypothetical protein